MKKGIDSKTVRGSIYAEKIDLAKLGWNKVQTDQKKLSYIRGYIYRNYRIRIKDPLDYIILCMILDALVVSKKNFEDLK